MNINIQTFDFIAEKNCFQLIMRAFDSSTFMLVMNIKDGKFFFSYDMGSSACGINEDKAEFVADVIEFMNKNSQGLDYLHIPDFVRNHEYVKSLDVVTEHELYEWRCELSELYKKMVLFYNASRMFNFKDEE